LGKKLEKPEVINNAQVTGLRRFPNREAEGKELAECDTYDPLDRPAPNTTPAGRQGRRGLCPPKAKVTRSNGVGRASFYLFYNAMSARTEAPVLSHSSE
jgi:hypothetical protein